MKIKEIAKMVFAGLCFTLLLVPATVSADLTTKVFLAGWYGSGEDEPEDPWGYPGTELGGARHPEDCALGPYVAVVYSSDTSVADPDNEGEFIWNIRLGYSSNYGGTSWSSFGWVDYDENVQQDYPDVQIFVDRARGNSYKLVVVWQERPTDDPDGWEIKAKEWNITGNSWGSTRTFSESNDNKQNIFPKISVCSDDENDLTYWNVVWQRDYYTNRFGIKLRRFFDDGSSSSMSTITTIEYPTSGSQDYKHPAVDCIISDDNYIDIYIIYDVFLQNQTPDSKIKVVQGYPSGGPDGQFSSASSAELEISSDGDYSLGFPDIAVVGDTSDEGDGNTVDCVWINWTGSNTNVNFKRSIDDPIDFTGPVTQLCDDNGYMALRSVAIDTYVTTSDTYKCTVGWTNGYNIYSKNVTGSSGDWNSWGSIKDISTTARDEEFVDVSLGYGSSSIIYSHFVWGDSGTSVWYGRDP